jgi:hypothetical protein
MSEVVSKTVAEAMEAFKFYKRMEGRMRRTLSDYDRVLGDALKAIGDAPTSDLKPATIRA